MNGGGPPGSDFMPPHRRHGRRRLAATAGLMVLFAVTPTAAQQTRGLTWLQGHTAILQGLDKVTARTSTVEAPVEQPVRFGSLNIAVRGCFKRPPEEPPESAAFLIIEDVQPRAAPVPVFSGWMFASSPALSALEHAVYDIWVLDCQLNPPAAPEGQEQKTQ